MLRLRNLLLHNTIYIIIFLIVLYITMLRFIFEPRYLSKDICVPVESIIKNYYIDEDKLVVDLDNNIRGTYYIESSKDKEYLEKNIRVGDTYKIDGGVSIPRRATTRGLFDYNKYLKTKKIYYILEINNIKKIKSNNNIIYRLKNIIIKRINNNPYLNTFLLGNKSYLDGEAVYSYQENGISHLFAISGMHITLLSSLILKMLKKIRISENKRYFITSFLLIIYLFIVGFSPSILRGVLFFILFSINNIYYFYINKINLYLVALSITLLINPFYIYDIGFIYSFTISLALLLSSNYLNSNNYFISLLKTSYISFISSIPISLYNYCSINILSIIYNLFYVPFVSIIIFPLSLVVSIIPIFLPIYNFFIKILEISSLLLSKISIGKFIFKRLHISIYILLLIVIFILIIILDKYKRDYLKYIFIFLIIIYFILPYLNKPMIKMIDVGQGDSILLVDRNRAVLVDTGGVIGSRNSIVKNTTIPILKSLGIKEINLILTHGDYDHLGETLNLLKYYKVNKIVINSNYKNYLERKIIKNFNNILIGYEGYNISIGDIKMIQLNEDMNDENDSSQVYYVKYKNRSILLTGDASIRTEKLLLEKYDLDRVDILKVGHHGSKTSTSDELLNILKPEIALISCGLNNKFNHPNKEVIDKLNKNNISIFRTDILGTITINLNNLKVIY